MDKLSLCAQRIIVYLIERHLGFHNSPSVHDSAQRNYMFHAYMLIRSHKEWTTFELKSFRPLLYACAGLISEQIIVDHRRITEILTLKSALVLIAQDFPKIADNLLYSPLMVQLDELQNHWMTNKQSNDTINYIMVDAIRKTSYLQRLAKHTWWCFTDTMKTMKAEPFSEVERAKNVYHYLEHSAKSSKSTAERHLEEVRRALHDADYEANFYGVFVHYDNQQHGHPSIEMVRNDERNYDETLRKSRKAFEDCRLRMDTLTTAIENAKEARIRSMEASEKLDSARLQLKLLGEVVEADEQQTLAHFKEAELNRYRTTSAVDRAEHYVIKGVWEPQTGL